jgi:fatty-acyl-CoA synthase
MPAPFPTFPAGDDAVRRWALLAPERTALVEHDGAVPAWTYAALDRRADGWARALAAAGVGAGDRVALLAGTRGDGVALFYGCLRAGAVLVPLNWRLSPAELARVLGDARPAALVVEPRHAALAAAALALPDAAPAAAAARPAADAGRLAEGGPADAPPARDDDRADDATMILYTSGSTGAPKGVVLPRRQLLYNAVATTTAWELGPGEVVPVSTPLFHTGGWHVFLTPALHAGATAVLFDGFEPDAFLAGLAAHGCTRAFAVPTQLTMLLGAPGWGAPLPRLRRVVSGGAPCPPAVRAAVRALGVHFREGYGLTECGPNCFTQGDAAGDAAAPGVVGLPAPFLRARLADADGRPAPDGVAGELLVRGPQMFAGYFGRPGLTADALTADGYLRTGDLAAREPDGRYRICGRRKEMYISGGENVFPGEVEAALADCPGVAEVAVVGVPDARWGEVGCAFVVARGAAPGAPDAAAVTAHARRLLAGYKVPKRVVVLDAPLPRLGSGKVDRQALAARARG